MTDRTNSAFGTGQTSGSAQLRRGAYTGALLVALAVMALQPRWADAATAPAIPPLADYAITVTGFQNACSYQVWTNGTGLFTYQPIPPNTTTLPVSITGLGTPTFSGILTTATALTPQPTPFIDIVGGNLTWSVPYGSTTDNTCVQWDGYFLASQTGSYTFTTASDDGSLLYIGTTQVVFNDYSQGVTPRSGSITLNAGYHAITIMYGNGTGSYAMTATSSFNGAAAIPVDTNLFLRLLSAPTFSPPAGAYSQASITVQVNEAWPTVASVSTAIESGTTVTITTTAAHNLSVGQTVQLANIGIASYNGTYTILSVPTTTTFTVTNATANLTAASGGTVALVGTIYYTTDGTTPTTNSPVYAAPFQVPIPRTVNAIATAPTYNGSPVATAVYSQTPTATPTFSIPSGSYTGAKNLVITSTTTGAFIYYTLDGSTPTFQNYSGVGASPLTIPLTGNVTVTAFASAYGFGPSAIATATYTRTDVAPVIVSCLASGINTQVNIAFNKVITLASANNIANYSISNGIVITAAALDSATGGDNKTVRLTISSTTPLQPGVPYTITVTNISDTSTPADVIVSATRLFQYFNGGGLLYERWQGLTPNYIPGSLVTDLTNSALGTANAAAFQYFPDFPDSPATDNGGEVIPTFEIPYGNALQLYGSRTSGYFIAPPPINVATTLTFAVAADDTALLSISSDDNPFKKSFVTAKVSNPTLPQQWNYNNPAAPYSVVGGTNENQVSVSMIGGKRYYIELLQKQNVSTDYGGVTYVTNNGALVDQNSFLGATPTPPASDIYDPNNTGSGPVQLSPAIDALRVVGQPVSQSATANEPVTLKFDVAGSAPRTVQWSLDIGDGNGPQDIPGATFPIYQIISMSAANAGTYVCRQSNLITTTPIYSNPAIVTLIDTTSASVTSISPNFDALAGGSTITITGTDFILGMGVTIGGKQSTIVSVTPTVITLIDPASTVKGTVTVVVTKPGQQPITIANGFTYDDIPTATAATYTINEDTPTSTSFATGLTLVGVDPTDKIVSFTITQQPTKGILSIPSATLANKSSTGTVVTMTTAAAHGFTVGQTVSVKCIPADANIDTVAAVITTVPDTTHFTFAKTATAVASATTGGTVQLITFSGTSPVTSKLPFIYTPNKDQNNSTGTVGPDTFTFIVNDGLLNSPPATVTINITPVNDPPTIVNPGNMTVTEDVPTTINLTGIAVGPVTATDEIASQTLLPLTVTSSVPSLFQSQDGLFTNTLTIGSVVNGVAQLSFTPAYGGTATITVTVTDTGSNTAPNVNSTVIQFMVTVTPVNDPPVITNPGPQAGTSDVSSTIVLTGIAPAPSNNPDETGQAGLMTLSVSASDPTYFASLTANPTINFTNHTDVNGNTYVTGTAVVAYVPNYARHGPVTITVIVNDHQSVNNTTTMSFVLTLAPVNHAPVAVNDSYSPTENKVLNVPAPGVLSNDSDVDGDPITAILEQGPSNGMLTLNPDGSFSYTPNTDYTGTDTFSYFANDGKLNSNAAIVTLSVGPNVAPVAVDGMLTVLEDVGGSGTLTGTDANFDTLTYSIVTQPSIGNVVITNTTTGAFTFTPPLYVDGTYTFTFQVYDGQLYSATAGTETIVITHVNHAPMAVAQTVYVGQNKSLVITLTGTDVDDDSLTFSTTTSPVNGTLSAVAQATSTSATVTYTPNANYVGSDTFAFIANDGTVNSAPANVTVVVTPPPVFSVTPTILPNPALTDLPVTFGASATVVNGVATITWDFGDGNTGTGNDITHVYSQAGVFVVTVTATSPEGLTATYTQDLQVGIGLGPNVPPGAIPPGGFGFLVGGAGITAGDSAALAVNFVQRDKTSFTVTVTGIAYPPALNQGEFVNQVGILTIGQGKPAQQFVFTLTSKGTGKATGLTSIQVDLAKGSLSFKETGRKEVTDLIAALLLTSPVEPNGHLQLDIPVSLQIGTNFFVAMTFELDYLQSKTTGKGTLIVPSKTKKK